MTNSLNADLRALIGDHELRFDDDGQLVPAEQPTPTDQTERHAAGSGDGGKGLDASARPEQATSLNDALRKAIQGY